MTTTKRHILKSFGFLWSRWSDHVTIVYFCFLSLFFFFPIHFFLLDFYFVLLFLYSIFSLPECIIFSVETFSDISFNLSNSLSLFYLSLFYDSQFVSFTSFFDTVFILILSPNFTLYNLDSSWLIHVWLKDR